jgi:hypothetical protein
MFNVRFATAVLTVGCLLAQPASAQSRAVVEKAALEFQKNAQAFNVTLAGLSKRATTASPHDKEMLNLVVNQLSVVDATADGVTALGLVAGQMRDASDLSVAKKYLANRCSGFKSTVDSTAPYVGSLTSNIAAVAIVAEVGKAKDLALQLGQLPLCASVAGKG